MANEELLTLFKEGAESWNQWRRDYPDVIPDLRGINLSKTDLRKTNLKGACLREANLSKTDLRGVNLSNTDLRGVNLTQANLSEANLTQADLNSANLTEANLTEVILLETQALGTKFEKTKLTGVCIKGWQINNQTNFRQIICDFVYLQPEQQERRPLTGNFVSGQFLTFIHQIQATTQTKSKLGDIKLNKIVRQSIAKLSQPEFRKKIIWSFGITGLLIVGGVIWRIPIMLDERHWQSVARENTIESYSDYQEKRCSTNNKKGKYCEEAQQLYTERVDDRDWQQAQQTNTIQSYQTYLDYHPEGKYATEASIKIEDLDWQQAKGGNTIIDYDYIIGKYSPHGRYVSDARKKIDSLIINVCQHQPAGSAPYHRNQSGLHPGVIVYRKDKESSYSIYDEKIYMPSFWFPKVASVKIELVACVTDSLSQSLIESCPYEGGRTVQRYRNKTEIKLFEAKTGKLITKASFFNYSDFCDYFEWFYDGKYISKKYPKGFFNGNSPPKRLENWLRSYAK